MAVRTGSGAGPIPTGSRVDAWSWLVAFNRTTVLGSTRSLKNEDHERRISKEQFPGI